MALFEDAGRKEGLEIWRIQNFSPVALDSKEHGKFHEGDSYVILRTFELGNSFKWNIHFWLGRETTSDESGSAAILAVKLDDSLGGNPVQYREVQEHESQLFLSYFPSGVRYLPGGVNSGFSHINPNEPNADEPKKLYHVKGKRNIRIRQVEVSIESMNSGDCFILDAGNIIFVYHGRKSKRTERLKAIGAGNQIRDQDHAGRSIVKVLDEFSDTNELDEFFTELGSGSVETVPDESTGGNDENFEMLSEDQVSLFKVSDSSGEMMVEKLSEKPLSRSMLKSEDCFILDTITSGIYAWIGKGSTKKEKEEAMKKAEEFITRKNYPRWTRITRVVEGGEPSTFKEYFSTWTESGAGDLSVTLRTYGNLERLTCVANINSEEQTNSRMRYLVKSSGTAPTFSPDNGEGGAEMYRIENPNLIPVGIDNFGIFFGGDCYIVKYRADDDRCIIYCWLGKGSSQDDKECAVSHAFELYAEADGSATAVRVLQGFEPNHFNKIFKGRMIIFNSGHATDFTNIKDTHDKDGARLFRIRGTSPEDVRTVQLPKKASSLNSDDVFLLQTPDQVYLWFGKTSSFYERDLLRKVQVLLFESDPLEVEEGDEPDAFFQALGGKMDYPTGVEDGPMLAPKLYHFSDGKPSDEIFDFKKEDLESDEVFVLKFGEEVYIWLGTDTTEEMAKVQQYYKYQDRGLCFLIQEGREPERFRMFFPQWNA